MELYVDLRPITPPPPVSIASTELKQACRSDNDVTEAEPKLEMVPTTR